MATMDNQVKAGVSIRRQIDTPDFWKATPNDQRAILSQLSPDFAQSLPNEQDFILSELNRGPSLTRGVANLAGAAGDIAGGIGQMLTPESLSLMGEEIGGAFQREAQSFREQPFHQFALETPAALGGGILNLGRLGVQGAINLPGEVHSRFMGRQLHEPMTLPQFMPPELLQVMEDRPVTSFIGEAAVPIGGLSAQALRAGQLGRALAIGGLEGAAITGILDPEHAEPGERLTARGQAAALGGLAGAGLTGGIHGVGQFARRSGTPDMPIGLGQLQQATPAAPSPIPFRPEAPPARPARGRVPEPGEAVATVSGRITDDAVFPLENIDERLQGIAQSQVVEQAIQEQVQRNVNMLIDAHRSGETVRIGRAKKLLQKGVDAGDEVAIRTLQEFENWERLQPLFRDQVPEAKARIRSIEDTLVERQLDELIGLVEAGETERAGLIVGGLSESVKRGNPVAIRIKQGFEDHLKARAEKKAEPKPKPKTKQEDAPPRKKIAEQRKVLQDAERLAEEIQTGQIEPELVTNTEIAKLAARIKSLREAQALMPDVMRDTRNIVARLRRSIEDRRLKKADEPVQPKPEAKPEAKPKKKKEPVDEPEVKREDVEEPTPTEEPTPRVEEPEAIPIERETPLTPDEVRARIRESKEGDAFFLEARKEITGRTVAESPENIYTLIREEGKPLIRPVNKVDVITAKGNRKTQRLPENLTKKQRDIIDRARREGRPIKDFTDDKIGSLGKGDIPQAAIVTTERALFINPEGQVRTLKVFDGPDGSRIEFMRPTGETAPFRMDAKGNVIANKEITIQGQSFKKGDTIPQFKGQEALTTKETIEPILEGILRRERPGPAKQFLEAWRKGDVDGMLKARRGFSRETTEKLLDNLDIETRRKIHKKETGKDC